MRHWPRGKMIGRQAEGPQLDSASALVYLQKLCSVDNMLWLRFPSVPLSRRLHVEQVYPTNQPTLRQYPGKNETVGALSNIYTSLTTVIQYIILVCFSVDHSFFLLIHVFSVFTDYMTIFTLLSCFEYALQLLIVFLCFKKCGRPSFWSPGVSVSFTILAIF